jgi:hypothetical protein
MKTLVRAIIRWALGFEIGTMAQFDLEVSDKMPEDPKDNTIYFIKEGKK